MMNQKNEPLYTISVAARISGMQPRALRLYEEMGIISPQRREKGHRLYSQEDMERLSLVHEMATMYGINLAGIKFVLDLMKRLSIELDAFEGILREI
jgi:MerR family transcriptional regulator/heat shock protein HspR